MWADGVVPVPVKAMGFELNHRHLLVLDFTTVGAAAPIKLSPYTETARRAGGGYQAEDHRHTDQLLNFPFAQANMGTVASSSACSDQQSARSRVQPLARLRSSHQDDAAAETGRIMVSADADPARVAGQVINAAQNRLALLRNYEVVDSNKIRGLLRPPLYPRILKVPCSRWCNGCELFS
jgi:hypothetical protein